MLDHTIEVSRCHYFSQRVVSDATPPRAAHAIEVSEHTPSAEPTNAMPPKPRSHTNTIGRQTPWRRRPPRSCPPRSAGGSSGTRGRSTPCASMVRGVMYEAMYEALGNRCVICGGLWEELLVNVPSWYQSSCRRRQTVLKCFCNPITHERTHACTTSQGRVLHDGGTGQGP